MNFVDKKNTENYLKIGVFDSGIGGFSILDELFKSMPLAHYLYVSDDAHAPYGPKSDEFIIERSKIITNELLMHGVSLIVVACNTATAAAIDTLRHEFPNVQFVGVEPYINAYAKENNIGRMAVLTTESTGKSERFKRLKLRLDPLGAIDHYSLVYLAALIEDFYHQRISDQDFLIGIEKELYPLQGKGYTHLVLGCTHYPLVRKKIESFLNVKALSPCQFVARRVLELTKDLNDKLGPGIDSIETFNFLSTKTNQWVLKNRISLLKNFKNKETSYV